ncbi:MAG TPA: DUF5107 domain-containing protein, partial [Propionicimonas sp.]
MLTDETRLELPERPAALAARAVAAWREPVVVDTYLPDPPDRYPAYLDRRVYQGSSGRIYPLPFHERISPTKAPHRWDAIHLENEYVRLMVMPELGGRIQVGVDRTNGYDFFYRNTVIKPALVGLAGPWLSGGVELNWPQHHRPATFLPTDAVIEEEPDGSVTVWCSDHDPFTRMKGMHGVRLAPGSSVVELRVRLFNRTDEPQSFLWWANVAAKVGDGYQSFFPTDVRTVADHAKRAVSAFPAADRPYYGVDYPARVDTDHPDADRIDWYRNIPVPTSYMAVGSSDDFFGGYDHGARAGFVHWADHRLAPGKKQWTWGNAPFGWAWDANLSDGDGPYVELMAGVYTDNQPDFSWLAPGETRAFSQCWYPIREVGPVQQATREAAVSLAVTPAADGTDLSVGVAVTRERPGLRVSVRLGDGRVAWQDERDAGPGAPFLAEVRVPAAVAATDVEVVVEQAGRELLRWRPRPEPTEPPAMAEAVEPPAPEAVAGVEELFLTGLHLAQYRHATRDPEPYWREALRRDPGDSRSHLALAARQYDAADYPAAERHVRAALARLTALNPNPADGEASFRLGQVLARTGRVEAAYDAYAKAAWNRAWAVPAHLAMARLRAAAGCDAEALDDARAALAGDPRHLQVRDLTALLLRRTGRQHEADALLEQTLAADPLDWWARHLAGETVGADAPTVLDVALEYAAAGDTVAAAELLQQAAAMPTAPGQVAVAPLALYHLADLRRRGGDDEGADAALAAARDADATWCLASRLDDADMLVRTCAARPDDARAHALLGHWLYAHGRQADAVAAWTSAARLDDTDPVVRRNLGIAAVNLDRDLAAAAAHYAQARALAPDDARLLFEADQLAKISGTPAEGRLAVLEATPALVGRRDDLTVELVALLTATGRADEGLALLLSRRFQPWEGGEGQVLAAWDEAHLALAREAAAAGDPLRAATLLREALAPVASLGEGRHLLANSSHLLLALGDALAASGAPDEAEAAWRRAAAGVGDFQSMATTPFSEMTYYAVLARRRLGQDASADALLAGLEAYTRQYATAPAVVDYFATSLPSMLLFDDDLAARRDARALVLGAQAALLRGRTEEARRLTGEALGREPWNVRALDLGRE